jgi:hypothetical protein
MGGFCSPGDRRKNCILFGDSVGSVVLVDNSDALHTLGNLDVRSLVSAHVVRSALTSTNRSLY